MERNPLRGTIFSWVACAQKAIFAAEPAAGGPRIRPAISNPGPFVGRFQGVMPGPSPRAMVVELHRGPRHLAGISRHLVHQAPKTLTASSRFQLKDDALAQGSSSICRKGEIPQLRMRAESRPVPAYLVLEMPARP